MTRQRKYTREFLEPIVRESYSVSEVVRKLYSGRYSTSNVHYMRNLIISLEIPIDHFLPNGFRKGVSRKKLPDNELFSNPFQYGNSGRSGYINTALMKRLIELGKEYKCDSCGLFEWNGKPIRLQLEHIDGDRYNNSCENLSFLCPNCHSQTDTYCRGKKKLAA